MSSNERGAGRCIVRGGEDPSHPGRSGRSSSRRDHRRRVSGIPVAVHRFRHAFLPAGGGLLQGRDRSRRSSGRTGGCNHRPGCAGSLPPRPEARRPLKVRARRPPHPQGSRNPHLRCSRPGPQDRKRTRRNPGAYRAGSPRHLPHPRGAFRARISSPRSDELILSSKQRSGPVCSFHQRLYFMNDRFAQACPTI